MDHIFEWKSPEYLHKDLPYSIPGFDKNGGPGVQILQYLSSNQFLRSQTLKDSCCSCTYSIRQMEPQVIQSSTMLFK